jgi:hypothetical protein
LSRGAFAGKYTRYATENDIQDLFAKNLHAENVYADHAVFSTLSAGSTVSGTGTSESCVLKMRKGKIATRARNWLPCSPAPSSDHTQKAPQPPTLRTTEGLRSADGHLPNRYDNRRER